MDLRNHRCEEPLKKHSNYMEKELETCETRTKVPD